ncbi:MAG: hypothetical protein ACRC67_02350, partial [Inquilinus sp.]|uniref:hypothetical protein n=1 Tax=Inquilinus sp. TaxID=1932117 RepID=UPI003F41A4AF
YWRGRLTAVSPLPVLTDSNVRCAPVLETTASRLTPAHFQTISERADKLEPPMSNQLERAA